MAIEEVDPQEAKALQDQGWTYVDVRTPEEFVAGHPAGAVNVPVALAAPGGMRPNPEFLSTMQARFGTDAQLLLGCKSGGRSMNAANLLSGAGYVKLANVTGGFLGAPGRPGWDALGLPTEQGE